MRRIMRPLLVALFLTVFFPMKIQARGLEDYYEEFNAHINFQYQQMNNELKNAERYKGQIEYMYHYNDIVEKYSEWIDVSETVYDIFTKEEIDYVVGVIEAETGGQTFGSAVNVANVILNRYLDESGDFPDTLIGIVTQENQFARRKKDVSENSRLAFEYAYLFDDTTSGALWFNCKGVESWASKNAEYLFTDDSGHEFYKQ